MTRGIKGRGQACLEKPVAGVEDVWWWSGPVLCWSVDVVDVRAGCAFGPGGNGVGKGRFGADVAEAGASTSLGGGRGGVGWW